MATQNGWNNKISTGSAITLNCGTNALNISSDASAGAVNLATGAAPKVVTLGSTNAASSLALQYGTADFSLASATGNVMVALDSGEITKPLQPAFLATHSVAQDNVTGNNTLVTINFTTEVFDQGADYDGINTFTAPITGRYQFNFDVFLGGLTNAVSQGETTLSSSNRDYRFNQTAWGSFIDLGDSVVVGGAAFVDMDTADIMIVKIRASGIGSDTADLSINATRTWFSGFLVC